MTLHYTCAGLYSIKGLHEHMYVPSDIPLALWPVALPDGAHHDKVRVKPEGELRTCIYTTQCHCSLMYTIADYM